MNNNRLQPLARAIQRALPASSLACLLLTQQVAAQQNAVTGDSENTSQDVEVIEISYGYSAVEKTDLTGAIATVDLEDIIDLPAGNVMQNLQGRVPGLQITTNGNPSSGATVRIRGQGLGPLGNNDPLYVIDGIPTKSGLQEINSNDIADVQVLRDAAAASIYGARSGNGVIVVTTKRGYDGLDFNFRYNQTVEDYNYDLQPLTTQQRASVVWQAAVNDGIDPDTASPLYSFDWNQNYNNPQLRAVEIPQYTDPQGVQQAADTRWFDLATRTSTVTDMNFSVTGGSERSQFYASLGYYDAEGIIDGSKFERLAFRVNSQFDIIEDKLKVGQTFLITDQKANLINDLSGQILGLSIEQQSIVPVYNDVGGWGGPVPGITDRDNPIRLIEQNRDNDHTFNKVMASFYTEYEPVKDLVFRGTVALDYGQFYFRNFQRAFTAGSLSGSDRLTVEDNYNQSIITNATVTYKWEPGENHKFNFLAGIEQIDFERELSRGIGSGFASDDRAFAYLSQATTNIRVDGEGETWALDSQFARIDYNYDNRYLASFTIRRDGSSRFGKNNGYGNFPAASFGWVVSNEDFFDIEAIKTLKLRASIGETGNQEIATNATFSTYVPRYATQSLFTDLQDEGTAYDIRGQNSGTLPSGFVKAQTGNPDLKWETSTQTNIGVDFELYDGEIYGSIDWFNKETRDILTLTQPIATLGEGAQMWVNGGTIENEGFELVLGYDKWIKPDFLDDELQVDINFNLSTAENTVTALPEDVVNSFGGNGQDKTILGKSINSVFGYVADGLFQSEEEVAAHATQAGAGPGRIRYKDLDGNGVINENDQDFFTDTDPSYIYGVNFTFRYQAWDFNMFWQGVKGGQIRNNWRLFTDFTSLNIGSNYGARTLDAWTPENTDTDVPALTLIDNNGEGRQSSFFWEEGTYLKLRNVSIGYTPSLDFIEQLGLADARIYLQGQNLLTITPDGTLSEDPETPNEVFPVPRRITIGVELSF
ncbi:SusC/RagA family TonB-linked outer membrane protein [Salinimonas lutimaris]|uniref:SusC/RagA family TonB-linked outer membrane protein n=1 Tax=Salinimonas lutimaris TaxID=914153 RepID=UPI0010C1179C|nr:SusC/RagA family TonB-linked outer membrane protein [Salinimonas lutimaris]